MTLPLIYALNSTDASTRRKIVKTIRRNKGERKKIDQVVHFVKEHGGLTYAYEEMMKFRQEAFDLLEDFPDSPAKEAMHELVYYITERKK